MMYQESEVYQEQESKASDSVRIAEPVATSGINPEVEQTEGQLAANVHSPAQDPVDSVRIAEPDSARESKSDSTTKGQPFEEEPDATGPLLVAYQRIHQLNKLARRRLGSL